MSLTAITLGSIDFPSYASVSEADRYLAADPARSEIWAALSDAEKGQRLVAATRRLDMLPWTGQKADPSQFTQWPRSDMPHAVTPHEPGGIPEPVETAAILLAVSPSIIDPGAGRGDSIVQSERVGPKAVTYFRSRRSEAETILGDRAALDLIRHLLCSDAAPMGAYVSGGQTPSEFTPLDRYGRTSG